MAPGFCSLRKDACKRPELSCRRLRLQLRLPLQSGGRSRVLTSRNPNSPLKAYPDHVRHWSVSRSAPVSGAFTQ